MRTDTLGLYLHIPFCRQKCHYCDFYSLASSARKQAYTDALCTQIACEGQKRRETVDTVFLGGGTPTALSKEQLCQIFDAVRTHFTLASQTEWSMEANPATVTEETLKELRARGLNRISFGVQSTHERELAALGRIHTVAQAREAVEAAKRAGIENISVDLMLAIPHQTPHTLAQSIATVCEWGITHLSLYGLRIEDSTPFARVRDTLPLPDEDTEVQMYYDAVAQLESLGFAQYEISNFAKEDCACRHNLKYWHAEPYLGLGTAAHSFLDGQRHSVRCDLSAYLAAAKQGDFSGVTEWEAPLAAKTAQDEYVMLALRLRSGVREADFAKRFDADFASCYGEKLQALMKKELIKHQNGAWILPTSVQYISNSILSELLDFQ